MHRINLILAVALFLFGICDITRAQNTYEQIKAEAKGDQNLVLELLSDEIKKHPDNSDLLNWRALTHRQMKNLELCRNDLRLAAKADPDSSFANFELAWFYATVPKEELRNPKLAIQYAEEACRLTKYRQAHSLEILAAALASDQQYEKASVYQRAALHAGLEFLQPAGEERLALYLDSQPCGFERFRFSGEVVVHNSTDTQIQIVQPIWIQENDKQDNAKTLTWTIPPGKKILLQKDGVSIVAKKFWYRVKTAEGVTPDDNTKSWHQKSLGTSKLVVTITKNQLPPRRIVTAKPIISSLTQNGSNKLAEDIEAINEGLGTLNEIVEQVKPLLPKRKVFPAVGRRTVSADLIIDELAVHGLKVNSANWDGGLGDATGL